MGQKKKLNILVILIILIFVLILLAGFAYIYLATDLLKSNKELFFKYATQIANSEDGFIDNNLQQYFGKKQVSPYTNNGIFSVNITSDNQQEKYNNANNFNISFSGEVDKANSKNSQNIQLNYSDSVNFPISYKRINNTIGLQTDYVGNKFIAVETDKLTDVLGNITAPIEKATSSTSTLQEITESQLSEDEINHIKNTYIASIKQQLSDEKFSKIEESDLKGYKLTITGEEIKNIFINLLETFKNDQTMLNKINEYLSTEGNGTTITTTDIDDLITDITNNYDEISEEQIEITVYSKSGKIAKILIGTQEGKISIEKSEENSQQKLNITYENDFAKISLGANFEGLTDMQSVKENYTIDLQNKGESGVKYQFVYQINNEVNFTDNINIEEFTTDNTMILNNYEEEQVSNFLQAVVQRIVEVNKQQMEELGLEESENPIQYLFEPINLFDTEILDQASTAMSETEINTFNSKFDVYTGTTQSPQTVKGLLSTIELNNQSEDQDCKITEINFCGEEYEASEQNIAFIKEDINLEKTYRIEFEKDQDTGVIYRAVINER